MRSMSGVETREKSRFVLPPPLVTGVSTGGRAKRLFVCLLLGLLLNRS